MCGSGDCGDCGKRGHICCLAFCIPGPIESTHFKYNQRNIGKVPSLPVKDLTSDLFYPSEADRPVQRDERDARRYIRYPLILRG